MSPLTERPAAIANYQPLPARSRLVELFRALSRKPLGVAALCVLLLMLFAAMFGPYVSPYEPRTPVGPNFTAPNAAHPFGTDFMGRDLLSRVIAGARVSVFIGFGAVILGTVTGAFVGLTSAFYGGWLELLVQRLIDAAQAIPLILIAVVIVSLAEPSIANIIVALGLAILPRTARVVHGATHSISQSLYIEAARAVGCPNVLILWRYILPNVFAPILIVASVVMGAAILAESSLSFLGLGDPTQISWGGMLSGEGRAFMTRAPWMAVFPGLAIMTSVLAFNLLGDTLRDILDPRLRV